MRSRPARIGAATLLESACPYLFLIVALVSTLFLAWNLPPFMGADELAHAQRAYVGANGKAAGERIRIGSGAVSGGKVSASLLGAYLPFDDIRFRPQEKADTTDFVRALTYSWRGPEVVSDFAGAAIYPPMFYVPASLGLAAGRGLGRPVIQSLYLARACQAIACVAVGFVALLLARRSRLFLYSVLLLPMSLGLYSAITADGLLIATTALACALISRARWDERPMAAWEIVAAAACFACVGMTKPPYLLLSLALLAADGPRTLRWAGTAGAIAAALLWTAFTAATVQIPLLREGVALDPAGQIAWLASHPLAVIDIGARTLAVNWGAYRTTVIGVLGWLDAPMPSLYYTVAWTVLALALIASASFGGAPAWRKLPWATLLIAVATFGAIHAALYVTWSAVGAPVVEGVAGRYFLPLLCFLTLAMEGGRGLVPDVGAGRGLRLALATVVLAFPLATLLLVERVVILRYYLD